MTDRTKSKPQTITRRLPADARRQVIVSQAASLFSDAGFDVSTRDIAGRCGITQAALYKHFRSKDEIVKAVFRANFLDRDLGYFAEALTENDQPLGARITSAYQAFFGRLNKVSHRLFLRAAMDGYPLPSEFSAPLDHGILEPLAAQLRIDRGGPPLDVEPPKRAERELVMLLHGAVVFLALRKNVYNIPLDDDAEWIIEQDVQVWLTGARQRLDEIWAT